MWIDTKEITRLKEDLKRNRHSFKGILVLFPYRLAKSTEGFPLVGSLLWFCSLVVQHLFGVIFFRKCDIGGGLSLAHGTGLVINLKSMGERCALRQNTTIGIGRGGIPTIGNDVFIGPNSVIIGGITVGDGAIIGAGAVVIRDVPPSSIAVGNPARNLPIRPETERPPIY